MGRAVPVTQPRGWPLTLSHHHHESHSNTGKGPRELPPPPQPPRAQGPGLLSSAVTYHGYHGAPPGDRAWSRLSRVGSSTHQVP